MVITAVVQSVGWETHWSIDGRIGFGCRWQPAIPYNTTPVMAYLPVAELADAYAKHCHLRLTHLYVMHAATIGVLVTPIINTVGGAMYLEPWTTTAALSVNAWRNLDIPLAAADPAAAGYCLQLTMAGYGPADIVQLGVVGYIESTTEGAAPGKTPPIQPVSLEGYKWPLTRRL